MKKPRRLSIQTTRNKRYAQQQICAIQIHKFLRLRQKKTVQLQPHRRQRQWHVRDSYKILRTNRYFRIFQINLTLTRCKNTYAVRTPVRTPDGDTKNNPIEI